MGKGKPFNKFWIGWLIRSLRKNRIQGNPLLHSRKKKKIRCTEEVHAFETIKILE